MNMHACRRFFFMADGHFAQLLVDGLVARSQREALPPCCSNTLATGQAPVKPKVSTQVQPARKF